MTTVSGQTRHELVRSDPDSVQPLPAEHPALAEKRTIFPSTVVDAKDSPRLLISGHNNPKIGREVAKGAWAGMPIYTLTLEERATCPSSCFMLSACYGNAMPFARRNRHGLTFESKLLDEVAALSKQHPDGFVVRLHVLGDFYNTDYVRNWDAMLRAYPALRVYGYTARSIESVDPLDRKIADRIHVMNETYPDRCFIRWSSPTPGPFGATVITREPEAAIVPEGLVCPAETSASDNCASCGLCWSPATREKTIVFVLHGKGASVVKADLKDVNKKDADGLRQIRPFATGLTQWDKIRGSITEIRQVAPTDLYVDERYQRNLTRKSVDLIVKMCRSWDWRKFRPPAVTEDADGRLHVMDGQHTAIAAASHPSIKTIPVIVVDATTLAERAETFIGINRDRVAVTPSQIFYAELQANDTEAVAVKAMCDSADVVVLRQPPPRNEYGAGETLAIATLRKLWRVHGSEIGGRVLTILTESGLAPVPEWGILAVTRLLTDEKFKPRLSDDQIWKAIRDMDGALLAKAYARRLENGDHLPIAAANLIWEACK